MGNARATPQDVPLPIKGLDRSQPYMRQPPYTTASVLNARPLDSRDRLGIGKRAGFSKAFQEQMSSAGATRVMGMGVINEGLPAPGSTLGVETALSDNFDARSVASPADIGSDYVTARVLTNATGVQAYNSANIINISGSDNCVSWTDQFTAGNSRDWTVFAVDYYCVQDMTIRIYCLRQAAVAAGSAHGPNNGMSGCGPCIRMTSNLRSFLQARISIAPGGVANTVRFEIVSVNDNVVTVLANGANFALDGSATISDDLTIRIYEGDGVVNATCVWTSASRNESLTVTTSFNSGERRAGWASVGQAGISGAGNPANPGIRNVTLVQTTKYVPSSYLVYRQLTNTDNYFGTGYTVPSGWTAVYRSNDATPVYTIQAGPINTTADPTYPALDESNDRLRGTQRTNATATPSTVMFFTETASSSPSNRLGVDVTNVDDTNAFCCGTPVFRMSSDFKSFLYYQIDKSNNTTTKICRFTSSGSKAIQVSNTTESTLATFNSADTLNDVVFRIGDRLRWTDDGTTVRLYVNGMLLWSHTPAWTGSATDNLCGFSLGDASNTGGNVPLLLQGRVVQGETTTTDISEVKSLVVLSVSNKNYIGDLKAGSLSTTSGGGFVNSMIQWTSFGRKFYGVDGSRAKQVDPDALATSDYASLVTQGTLPATCRLIATYRGRIVLARQPNNNGIYYMSRTFDPFDWSYGTAPSATAAIAGSSAAVGQPADTITALIPFADDYLIFGCASSIWMMEGDPGYGGRVQNLSYQTGVLGPRAYCFDEQGNLYFIGSNGLYRIARGTRDPQLISGRRVSSFIDRVDTSATLIQLVYDSFKSYVNIFLTPTDGTTVGSHMIYDVRNDGFWLDQYPLSFGPWSCTQITGPQDSDRRYLMGTNDGYVMRPYDTVYADNGSAINSQIRLGPFSLADQNLDSIATEVQAFGKTSNATMNWYWLSAASAADLANMGIPDAVASGTFFGSDTHSFAPPVRLKARGGAHAIILSHNNATDNWALEGMSIQLAPAGRRRNL